MKTLKTRPISNEYAGVQYRTAKSAARAELLDFVTAGGLNPSDLALAFLADGKERNLAEMAKSGWVVSEVIVENWDDVARDVREEIESDLDTDTRGAS